jgi:hypothetical protein
MSPQDAFHHTVQLEALAAHESRTLSAMSRVLVLAGMKAFDNKPAT